MPYGLGSIELPIDAGSFGDSLFDSGCDIWQHRCFLVVCVAFGYLTHCSSNCLLRWCGRRRSPSLPSSTIAIRKVTDNWLNSCLSLLLMGTMFAMLWKACVKQLYNMRWIFLRLTSMISILRCLLILSQILGFFDIHSLVVRKSRSCLINPISLSKLTHSFNFIEP